MYFYIYINLSYIEDMGGDNTHKHTPTQIERDKYSWTNTWTKNLKLRTCVSPCCTVAKPAEGSKQPAQP